MCITCRRINRLITFLRFITLPKRPTQSGGKDRIKFPLRRGGGSPKRRRGKWGLREERSVSQTRKASSRLSSAHTRQDSPSYVNKQRLLSPLKTTFVGGTYTHFPFDRNVWSRQRQPTSQQGKSCSSFPVQCLLRLRVKSQTQHQECNNMQNIYLSSWAQQVLRITHSSLVTHPASGETPIHLRGRSRRRVCKNLFETFQRLPWWFSISRFCSQIGTLQVIHLNCPFAENTAEEEKWPTGA